MNIEIRASKGQDLPEMVKIWNEVVEEGVAFRDQALSVLHDKGYAIDEIPVYQIGATISVHTGPYPLGFGIIEKGIHAGK